MGTVPLAIQEPITAPMVYRMRTVETIMPLL